MYRIWRDNSEAKGTKVPSVTYKTDAVPSDRYFTLTLRTDLPVSKTLSCISFKFFEKHIIEMHSKVLVRRRFNVSCACKSLGFQFKFDFFSTDFVPGSVSGCSDFGSSSGTDSSRGKTWKRSSWLGVGRRSTGRSNHCATTANCSRFHHHFLQSLLPNFTSTT